MRPSTSLSALVLLPLFGCSPLPMDMPDGSPGSGGSSGGMGGGAGGSTGGTPGGAGGTPSGGAPGGSGGAIPGGGDWMNVTASLAGLPSECGAVGMVSARPDKDIVLTNVARQGLFTSADNAADWTKIGQGAGSAVVDNRVSSIVYDPAHPDTFWESGAYGPCVYKTTDAGATFTKLGDKGHCDILSVDFTDPDRKTLLAGGHEQKFLYRSKDGGATWEDIAPSMPGDAGNPGSPQIIDTQTYVVGTWGGGASGIYRSTNAGASWTKVSMFTARSRPLVASNGSIFWVADGNAGIIRSTDKGATWTKVSSLAPSAPWMVELPKGALAVPASQVMISVDQGATWKPVGSKLPYQPGSFTFAPFRKAFYVCHSDCIFGKADPVLSDAVMRMPFDPSTL